MTRPEDLPSGYGTPPEVVPPNPGRATLRHVPGGLRLPVVLSLVVLLLYSAGVLLVLGRAGADTAPPAVLDSRAAIAHATAQSMRKGLDEAVDDLVVLGVTLRERPRAEWGPLLASFRDGHDRYLTVYLIGPDRRPQLQQGSARALVELLPDDLSGGGLTRVQEAGARPGLLAHTPLPGSPGLHLVGRYDTSFLTVALAQLLPGEGLVVDDRDRVVASTGGILALQPLDDARLAAVSAAVRAGEPVVAEQGGGTLVAASPVRGPSAAGRLGLSVLSTVDVEDLALPANEARRLGVLLGVLTALLAVLMIAWFWLTVVAPVRRLVGEAERVALGDRDRPLAVRRYDEIGLVERAVERCRVLLDAPGRR